MRVRKRCGGDKVNSPLRTPSDIKLAIEAIGLRSGVVLSSARFSVPCHCCLMRTRASRKKNEKRETRERWLPLFAARHKSAQLYDDALSASDKSHKVTTNFTAAHQPGSITVSYLRLSVRIPAVQDFSVH